MQNEREALRKPCNDCDGLWKGTRSNQEPHQYMVASATSSSARALTYLCLLCGTALTKEGEGLQSRWKL